MITLSSRCSHTQKKPHKPTPNIKLFTKLSYLLCQCLFFYRYFSPKCLTYPDLLHKYNNSYRQKKPATQKDTVESNSN